MTARRMTARRMEIGLLCATALAAGSLGSIAAWAVGFVEGAATVEETIAWAAEVAARPPDTRSWIAEFEVLDAMARQARPDLDVRERQWRVLLLLLAAHRYGVDPRLAMSVAIVESGFRQDVISAKGAVGIMQLMPATARALGANPYDVADNLDAGVRHLAELLRRYRGDVRLALAAYNAGPTRVTRSVPRIRETQAYVRRVVETYAGR